MIKANESIVVWWTRLSFPQIWQPQRIKINGREQGDPKYSACLVIPADRKEMVEAIQAAEARIKAKAWPDGNVPVEFHSALNWGPTVRPKDGNLVDCWIINAYANGGTVGPDGTVIPDYGKRPEVVHAGKEPFIRLNPENDQALVYSGCEAHVSIGLFSYQTSVTKGGIGAGLNLIQVTGREFPRFDNRPTAASAFGAGPPENAPPPPAGPAGPPAAPPQGGPQTSPQVGAQGGNGAAQIDLNNLPF